MANLGRVNELMAMRESDFGLYLDGGDHGEILLPRFYITEDMEPGDMVTAFVHRDSEDRLVATTEAPLAQVGDFASLRVKAIERVGAFLDWGLGKDLLMPFAEQNIKVASGQRVLVRVYVDPKTERIVASSKLTKFLDLHRHSFDEGLQVDLTIAGQTDLGYNVIINQTHWGLIFHDEVSEPLSRGQKVKGFIKQVREDGKIDVCLKLPGYERITGSLGDILATLSENGGFLPFNDKSDPSEIRDVFGMSKKTFKAGLGALYRKRQITIAEDGIRLVD